MAAVQPIEPSYEVQRGPAGFALVRLEGGIATTVRVFATEAEARQERTRLLAAKHTQGYVVVGDAGSDLRSRASELAAAGFRRVNDELDELERQGKVDAKGNLLVPLPDDMKADSSTDL